MRVRRATTAELIFEAVAALSDRMTEFDEFQITMAAWDLFPDRFGMIGHPHPDHKLVFCGLLAIVGCKSRNARPYPALIERCRANTYRLTAAGFRRKQELRRRSA
jgi:hypothetical protein